MIWKGSRVELINFINKINSVHKTIKFEVDFSKIKVNFLDTTITMTSDHILTTSLYQKPTDRHNFLHQKSYHPASTKKSLPYSQALRIKKICSVKEDFLSGIEKLKKQFYARGYDESLVNESVERAMVKDRKELLNPVQKRTKKNH